MSYRKIKLAENYKPSEKEPFMNENQKAYFYEKLTELEKRLSFSIEEALLTLKDNNNGEGGADEVDVANKNSGQLLDMRRVDRDKKQIRQIQKAYARLDNNNYGYCIDTAEPIALKRLEARPIATRTADAQANHEDND
ncbi:MAG: TraR/DksA family transcriptional regulator [Alphaproteobacteria bacterium]